MNFRLKSWDVFSWTAMRGGLFRLDRDRKVSLVPISIDFSTGG